MEIERTAKLLETGSYPDKNLQITEADLDNLVSSFTQAPVKLEHTDTPFDGAIGVLKKIWRQGGELFGSICFSKEAWALIYSCGARRLSVGLKRDKTGLVEVSLVKNPRVAGAVVFNDGIVLIEGDIQNSDEREEVTNMNEIEKRAQDLEAENNELKTALLAGEAQAKIDSLKREGRITPASEAYAKAILMSAAQSVIAFNGESKSISDMFLMFVEAQPKAVSFSEEAEAVDNQQVFSIEQINMLSKLGVKPEDAAKYMG